MSVKDRQMIEITPEGPLVFRDARPFTAGAAVAKTLPFPLPSAIAGTVRTMLGKSNGWDDDSTWQSAKDWTVEAPFLLWEQKVHFPVPADAYFTDYSLHHLSPIKEATSTNLPDGLIPVGSLKPLPKQSERPDFWSSRQLTTWLAGGMPESTDGFSVKKDRRIHVKMDSEKGTNEPTMLFGTEGIDFRKSQSTATLLAAVCGAEEFSPKGNVVHRIGGEGRFATFTSSNMVWPSMGETLKSALQSCKGRLSMQLVTPAVFAGGWRPDWLDKDKMIGSLPDAPKGCRLKLIGACVPRWKPLSGWDLEKKMPKALHRLVPAGSVYYFEVEEGNAISIAKALWMKAVSDDEQMRKDGFGIALWGTWDYAKQVDKEDKQ